MAYQKKKTTIKMYELEGKNYTLTDLCNHLGLKYCSVYRRLKAGKDITTAINECVNNPRTWGNTYGEKYNENHKTHIRKYENGI